MEWWRRLRSRTGGGDSGRQGDATRLGISGPGGTASKERHRARDEDVRTRGVVRIASGDGKKP